MINKKLELILSNCIICDSCLGRQFANLLCSTTNKRRGEILREYFAILQDAQMPKNPTNEMKVNLEKFAFNNAKLKINKLNKSNKLNSKKNFHCQICNNLFANLDKIIEQILDEIKKIEFDTFSIGIHLNKELLEKEEFLWDICGIEYCEPIKTHLSRNIGKSILKATKKQVNLEKPCLNILVDLDNNKIKATTTPIYIKGYCSKFEKIPVLKQLFMQTLKTSVQEIIEAPLLLKTLGTNSKFHTIGYESEDFLFSGKREFVIEIKNPKKRTFDLLAIEKQINKNKAINISNPEFTDRKYVIELKLKKFSKTYCIKFAIKDMDYFKNIKTILKQNNIKILKHTINKNNIELIADGFSNELKELNYIDKLDVDIVEFKFK